MTQQLKLFESSPLGTNQYGGQLSEELGAAFRKSDPESSKEAAHGIESSGRAGTHRAMILDSLRRRDGQTGHEIAADIGLDQVSVIRRLDDLRRLTLVTSKESEVPCRVRPRSKQNRWFLTLPTHELRRSA